MQLAALGARGQRAVTPLRDMRYLRARSATVSARRVVGGWGCENAAMPDGEPDGRGFEDVARAFAEDVHQAVERLSSLDLDDIAQAARADAERARGWLEDLAWSVAQTGDAARSPDAAPVQHAG